MTTLIRPDNGQPAAFVARLRGHICLRMADTVTPAVRWYKEAAVKACNTAADMIAAQLAADIEQARIEWNWPHVFLTPDKAAQVNASANVRICIVKPAPVVISLWHDSMTEARKAA